MAFTTNVVLICQLCWQWFLWVSGLKRRKGCSERGVWSDREISTDPGGRAIWSTPRFMQSVGALSPEVHSQQLGCACAVTPHLAEQSTSLLSGVDNWGNKSLEGCSEMSVCTQGQWFLHLPLKPEKPDTVSTSWGGVGDLLSYPVCL